MESKVITNKIDILNVWKTEFDDYCASIEISKDGVDIGNVIVAFDENVIRSTIGNIDGKLQKQEIENAIYALVASEFEKYANLPSIIETSSLLRQIYTIVSESESSMCYITPSDWDEVFSADYPESSITELKEEIKKYHLENMIELDNDGYKIIGYRDLETAFRDDRQVLFEKEITTLDFLNEEKQMILHNISCYSEGNPISKPKQGYEAQYQSENKKLRIVDDLISKEMLKTQNTDLDYYAFVIGYDFLHDYFINSTGPECDVVFDECYKLAKEFMKSDEYKNHTNTGYENLQEWLDNNENRIKAEYDDVKQPEEKSKQNKDRER